MFKLKPCHINPNAFDKLSVKLATQIFSHNVASAVYAAIAEGCFRMEADIKIAKPTAKFLSNINDLFDHLNGFSWQSNNPNKQPISESSDILSRINDCKKRIESWKSTSRREKPYCFDGLVQTIADKFRLNYKN